MLVKRLVVEQHYRVGLEVLEDDLPVAEVVMRPGGNRQAVHTWLQPSRRSGMARLGDRSRRSPRCARRASRQSRALFSRDAGRHLSG